MGQDQDSDWIGRVIASRYRILSCIGAGASARVYRAETLQAVEDLAKGAEVAVKISRPHILSKQRDAARFLREVQAIRRINHRCCVRIYDWGITDDAAYIVMELLEGKDLFKVMRKRGAFSVSRCLAIAIELCGVLREAHAEGVVHRDLKPHNIVLLPDGESGELEPQLKVLDFGLAKLFQHAGDDEQTMPDALTKPGSVLGTPHYMAPEQVRVDGEIDGRADLYAVAVMMYEMLTARRPYRAKNAVRLLILRSSSDPDPPSKHRPSLDPDVERLVMRGLQRNPDDRFDTAATFQRALAEVLPRIADEEGNMGAVGFASKDVASLDSPSSSISSEPPDTIEEHPTEQDDPLEESLVTEIHSRVLKEPAAEKPAAEKPAAEKPRPQPDDDDDDTTTYNVARLARTAAESNRTSAPVANQSVQRLYYALAIFTLAATVARLFGIW